METLLRTRMRAFTEAGYLGSQESCETKKTKVDTSRLAAKKLILGVKSILCFCVLFWSIPWVFSASPQRSEGMKANTSCQEIKLPLNSVVTAMITGTRRLFLNWDDNPSLPRVDFRPG